MSWTGINRPNAKNRSNCENCLKEIRSATVLRIFIAKRENNDRFDFERGVIEGQRPNSNKKPDQIMKITPLGVIVLTSIASFVLTSRAQNTSDQAQFPTILQQPVDQCLPVGATASFSVQAANATGYQWEFNGNPLSGETNETLTISNIQIGNVGYYSAAVINGSEVVPSRSANLNVYISGGSSLLTAPLAGAKTLLSSGSSLLAMDDPGGGDPIVVFGLPVVSSGGGGGSCPGKFCGYVNFVKTMSQGWGFAPMANTTVYTATDTNQTTTKVQYFGEYGDVGCQQTTVTVPYPAMSPVYRFTIYFPPGSTVPTNAYAITLNGFNP